MELGINPSGSEKAERSISNWRRIWSGSPPPRRDGFEQSRRGGYRNHRSCANGLRTRPFLVLRMSAELVGVVHVETDAVTAQRNNELSCFASADLNASR